MLMSIRKLEPIVIKHKERFHLRKESILWDLKHGQNIPSDTSDDRFHQEQESDGPSGQLIDHVG